MKIVSLPKFSYGDRVYHEDENFIYFGAVATVLYDKKLQQWFYRLAGSDVVIWAEEDLEEAIEVQGPIEP